MEDTGFNKIKIQSLLENLQTQVASNAGRDKVLAIAKMLLVELQQCTDTEIEKKNVSVVMPANIITATVSKEETVSLIDRFTSPESEKVIVPEKKIEVTPAQTQSAAKKPERFNAWESVTVSNEAPTIVLQNVVSPVFDKDLNETYATHGSDLSHSLQNTPIRDLTTAIGINDRYLFINELFRGDESMYDRTIITLNRFRNYEETFIWIERELRLKLGWHIENPVTKQFEQLIKRRFL